MIDQSNRILIVEDDVDLAEMLSAYFRVQGFEVDLATWGEDAIRLSSENTPDLVLMDIRLPDFDGFEVAGKLRERRRTRYTPLYSLPKNVIDKIS